MKSLPLGGEEKPADPKMPSLLEGSNHEMCLTFFGFDVSFVSS
jgi:hypothetical protein